MNRLRLLRIVLESILVVAAVVILALRLMPERAVAGMSWRHDVVYRVPTQEKVVALTFDDGPDPRFTPKILDILDKYYIKATFFMVGKQMDAYPDIVRDAFRRGHAIGNHTYTHPHDIELDTAAQTRNELERCERVIERLTGKRAHLFRPPRGMIDGSVFAAAEKEGYTTVLWTVCADHHDAPTPEKMAARVLAHSGPGAIVLAHDGTFCSRWMDVAATPMIIEELQARGYRFVTVPELLRRGNSRVVNP
jgi:peptidoglycan-N-acetylglucosamine deacetylase